MILQTQEGAQGEADVIALSDGRAMLGALVSLWCEFCAVSPGWPAGCLIAVHFL